MEIGRRALRYTLSIAYILLLVAILNSCDHPDQPPPPETNQPPTVRLAANTASLAIGDTLWLALHVADTTLNSGWVNFGDSTVATFRQLGPRLDTTIFHVYVSAGQYDISASFSDGILSSVSHLAVSVVNLAPLVTLLLQPTTINVGETLSVAVHAYDATLSNGLIDFGDGPPISFTGLHRILDTTIFHVYVLAGQYDISATFSDGILSSVAHVAVSVVNLAPLVTLLLQPTTIRVGEEVSVVVHASDATLSNGLIDFGDGPPIFFTGLHRSFDTTLYHVYRTAGTYTVSASFSDRTLSTSSTGTVVVTGSYFSLSVPVGMSWRFSYDYYYMLTSQLIESRQAGIHEWAAVGRATVGSDTVVTIREIRNDIRRFSSYNQTDTTFAVHDTSYFRFVFSPTWARLTWPLNGGTVTDSIPNHAEVNSIPFRVYLDLPYGFTERLYDTTAGPLSYRYAYDYSHGYSYILHESFTLLGVVRP